MTDIFSIVNIEPIILLVFLNQMNSFDIYSLNEQKDEHKLVIEQLSKLEGSRKAFRLVGEVLIERTVGEILPVVTTNFDGIKQIIDTLDATLKEKDQERRLYKEKHGIMTQEERDAVMKKSKAIKSA
jgi:prefoldin subunit 2